jgi:hypothetical protein
MFPTIELKLSGRGRNCCLGHGEHTEDLLFGKQKEGNIAKFSLTTFACHSTCFYFILCKFESN